MDEDREVDPRRPRERVEGGRAPREDPVENPKKTILGDRAAAVVRDRAAPLPEDPDGGRGGRIVEIGGAGEGGLRKVGKRRGGGAHAAQFFVASATSSITSHSTRSVLRRFARPLQRPARAAARARVEGRRPHSRPATPKPNNRDAPAPPPRNRRRGRFPTMSRRRRRRARRGRRAASRGPRPRSERADRMSHVVLAVAEGAFAVLPRLAPVDRAQPHEERPRTERRRERIPTFRRDRAALLERVVERAVVVERGGVADPSDRRKPTIALGGVEVPAPGFARSAHLADAWDFQAVIASEISKKRPRLTAESAAGSAGRSA